MTEYTLYVGAVAKHPLNKENEFAVTLIQGQVKIPARMEAGAVLSTVNNLDWSLVFENKETYDLFEGILVHNSQSSTAVLARLKANKNILIANP